MSVAGMLLAPLTALARQLRRLDLASGSIDKSDARILWEQADLMRAEMSARIVALEGHVAWLLAELDSVRVALAECKEREGHHQAALAVLEERLRQFERATTTLSSAS